MRDGTRVVRAGLPDFAQGEPFLPGPTFANPYHLAGDPSSSAYSYGRYHNPTWTHFEKALSKLEGGTAILFASGMAAVTAVFGSVLRPGSVLVMPSDGYYTARMLAEEYFAALGIEVRLAPTAGNAQLEHLEGATLLWLETPSNPGLDVCDLAVLIEEKRKRRWLSFKELLRLKNAATLLRGNKHQRSTLLNLFFVGLKLSHAFHAVRSPSATKELYDSRAALQ